VTYHQFSSVGFQTDAIKIVKSTDCGASFSAPRTVTTYTPMKLRDRLLTGGLARECGDSVDTCQSGYTFFRADLGTIRLASDQNDTDHEWLYLVYEGIVPSTEVQTGTTFGWFASGWGGQSSIYYTRYNGATGTHTSPTRVASANAGQQLFPDLAVANGKIHAMWWDTRNDVNNDSTTMLVRPPGNDADGNVGPAFDVYAAKKSIYQGTSWTTAARVTDVTSNGQYEQFSGRTDPFGGDYLWIDSVGGRTFGVWTDWRNTVGGTDPRETTPDETGADVHQCRHIVTGTTWSGDTCPRAGGLDQDIYGDYMP
jgi:hypothetical protein